MKKWGLIILILSLTFKIHAQNFELGEVTKAELEEKKHPLDSSASAAILFKKAKTIFKYKTNKGFVSYTDFSIKVKIYKKEGLSWANFKIPYYVGYEMLDDESVVISKAITYNLENGKIIKDKVLQKGTFIEEVNEFWQNQSVTFPNVKVGSIIEFNYILKSQNLSVLPDFQYQYKIPVNAAEYTTEIPEFYLYKGMKNGFVDINTEEVIENASQSFDDENKQTVFISYNQIKTKYWAKNVPALINEKFVNNINNYYGKIDHELETIRMPNEKPKQLAKTWGDVSKSIYSDKQFGRELEKFNYFANDVKPLVENLNTNQEKLIKIFEFVKNRMAWNGKYGYYTKKGVEYAYKEKTGNLAEINLMLVAMLKMAGIEANPVLISTRENGIALFPNQSRLNCVIASATIDGKLVLLDATDKFSTINVLPLRDLNWYGRLIQKDGTSSEVNLTPKTVSKDYVNLMAKISDNGEINGKLKEQYFDYNAFNFRDKYSNLSKESYLETLEKKYNNIEVNEYDVSNKTELDKPVVETYSFRHTNSVEIIGNKMYFSPMLFFAQTSNPFKEEIREYPVDFTYPSEDRFLISITIPDGYSVESIPAPVAFAFKDNLAGFKFNVSNLDKQIQVSVTLDINTSVISPEDYSDLKIFFTEMIKKQSEKVVLKKI